MHGGDLSSNLAASGLTWAITKGSSNELRISDLGKHNEWFGIGVIVKVTSQESQESNTPQPPS